MKHCKKLFCLALALVMLLGLMPGATAADSGFQLETTKADVFGYLGLTVTPYVGGLEESNLDKNAETSVSCWANIMLDSSSQHKVVPEATAYGLKAEATFTPNVPWGCHLEIWYTNETDFIKGGGSPEADSTPSSFIRISSAAATIHFDPEDGGSGSKVYYIYGVMLNESGEVLKYTDLSCEVSYVNQKSGGIYYTRTGFQARTVDGTALGQYDYSLHPSKVENTTGIYQDEGAMGTYAGLDGKQWSNAYFDLTYQETKAGKILGNLAEVQQNIRKVLSDAGKSKQGTTIVVSGPAYVQTTGGAKGTKTYNMEYYTGKNNEEILKYASWGAGTRTKDFVEHSMQTATIPLPPLGRVIIRCWDEDDMEEPLYETIKEISDFGAISDSTAFSALVSAVVDAYNAAAAKVPAPNRGLMDNQEQFEFGNLVRSVAAMDLSEVKSFKEAVEIRKKIQETTDGLSDFYSRYMANPKTGELRPNPHLSDAYFDSVAKAKVIRDMAIDTKLKTDPSINASLSFVNIQPFTAAEVPALEGYVFDYGAGSDTLTKMRSGNMIMVGSETSADVVVSDPVQDVIVNLYYKADAPTMYTVKVRKGGVVFEEYSRSYDGHTNMEITKDMVDTSIVPDGWKIQSITPEILTLKKDPTKNIIYIDCETSSYTVKVRYKGVEQEELTTSFPADPGTVITEETMQIPEIPEEWTIVDIENTPLTVEEDPNKNIIYINCDEPEPAEGTVTYNFYLDNVLTDTESEQLPIGMVVTAESCPSPYYPGYVYKNTDGVPLTVTDNSHVVRIYYEKDTSGTPAVNSNAKLFEDQNYRVEIHRSKSGYGVYGLLYVDVSDLIGKTRSVNYSTSGGCSGRVNHVKTFNPYGNINVTATATYYEGLPHTEANKNGQRITVNLVKDTARSTERQWVFRFPVNTRNKTGLAKAYIPINWKDGTDWNIQFNAEITYDEYSYTTTARQYRCGGHKVRHSYTNSKGQHCVSISIKHYASHNYTYYTLDPMHTDHRSRSATGSASIRVNGNMYEDDFTGGKR